MHGFCGKLVKSSIPGNLIYLRVQQFFIIFIPSFLNFLISLLDITVFTRSPSSFRSPNPWPPWILSMWYLSPPDQISSHKQILSTRHFLYFFVYTSPGIFLFFLALPNLCSVCTDNTGQQKLKIKKSRKKFKTKFSIVHVSLYSWEESFTKHSSIWCVYKYDEHLLFLKMLFTVGLVDVIEIIQNSNSISLLIKNWMNNNINMKCAK